MAENSNQNQFSIIADVKPCAEPTILDVLAQSGGQYDNNNQDFDILLNALEDSNLTESLSGENADLTFFAPTDEAFLKLSRFFGYSGNDEAAVLDVINREFAESNQADVDSGGSDSNSFNMQDVLGYHLLQGAKSSAELESLVDTQRLLETSLDDRANLIYYSEGTIGDLSPNTVDPKLQGGLTDLSASNGIIHGIDRVLFPYFLGGKYPIPPTTIADVLSQSGGKFDNDDKDFDILNKLLQTAELTDVFADPNADLTLFAPTDAAFIKLDEFTGGGGYAYGNETEELAYEKIINILQLTDKATNQIPDEINGDAIDLLQSVLKYHVAPGAQSAAEIQAATAPISTLLDNATIQPDNGKLIDQLPDFVDPQLQTGKTDITASNGIIQGIDNVLFPNLFASFSAPPSEPALAPSIADIVFQSGGEFDDNNQDFDILLNALQASGLLEAVADVDADLTVFAPTDAAFVKLAETLGYEGNDEAEAFDAIAVAFTELGNGEPISILQDVLKYHVSAGAKTLAEIKDSASIDTLLEEVSIMPNGDKLVDQDPNFSDPGFLPELTDIEASNGIIQGIDSVLLPRDLFENSIPNGKNIEGGGATDLILGNREQEDTQGNEADDLLFGGVNPYLLKGGIEFNSAEGRTQMFSEAKEGDLLFPSDQGNTAIFNPMTTLGSLSSTQGETLGGTENEKDVLANLSSSLINPVVLESSFM